MKVDLETHLQNIEEFVLVDDKIVTYKWISKVLKVHTNTAKQLLFEFSKSKNSDKLLTTFLIGGENGEKGLKFKLVTSKQLEETKRGFEKITAEHVYSVQRTANVSGSDIYNAEKNYEITKEDQKFSSIHANDQIQIREPPKNLVQSPEDGVSKSKIKTPIKKEEPKTSDKFKSEPLKPKQDTEVTKEDKKSPSPLKNGVVKKSPKKIEKKNVQVNKNSSIGAFFNRQNSTASKKEMKKNQDVEAKENLEKKNDEVEKPKIEIKQQQKENEQKTTPITPQETKRKTENKKKRKKNNEEDSKNKKRKRIRLVSDSESSDGEMEYEEPPPPSPEVVQDIPPPESDDEIIPVTPLLQKGKKRIRKQVDHTFTDDEGFIITKKEYVYESCTDDEVEPLPEEKKPKEEDTKEKVKETKQTSPKKTAKGESKQSSPKKPAKGEKAKKKKTNSPQKNKQVSITNFFRKK